MRNRRGWMLALPLALACGCSKPSDTTDAKRSPKPPPSASVEIPSALHIDVEIDGRPAPAIDGARLAATKPDFSDDDHRAWRITTLVGGPATRPGVVISAIADGGVALDIPAGSGPADPAAVLSLNRRGEIIVGLVTPDAPFPDFHGKGGRLARPGDPLPHLASPTKIRIAVAAGAPDASVTGTGTGGGGGNGGGAQTTGDVAPLKVVIPGAAASSWTPDALASVPRFTVHADGSDKDAWSLRDVAHKLVGPKAHVTAAIDGEGTRSSIKPKDWADAKKTPVLRINRRGMYKIEWVDDHGNMTTDDDVRDVRVVEVSGS